MLHKLLDIADEHEEHNMPLTPELIAAKDFSKRMPDVTNKEKDKYQKYNIPPLASFMPDKATILEKYPKSYNVFQRAGAKFLRLCCDEEYRQSLADKRAAKKQERAEKAKQKAEQKAKKAAGAGANGPEEEKEESTAQEVTLEKTEETVKKDNTQADAADAADANQVEETKKREDKKEQKKDLYSGAYKMLLNFRALASRFDTLKATFQKFQDNYYLDAEKTKRNKDVELTMENYVQSVSDLLLHSDENPPVMVINGLEEIFEMIDQMRINSEKLDDVEEMVPFISGTCFGARLGSIAQYYQTSSMSVMEKGLLDTEEKTEKQAPEKAAPPVSYEREVPKDGYRYITDTRFMPDNLMSKTVYVAVLELIGNLLEQCQTTG